MLPLITLADSQGQNGNMKSLSEMLSKELTQQGYAMNINQVFYVYLLDAFNNLRFLNSFTF